MADVFISYSRKGLHFVDKIVGYLSEMKLVEIPCCLCNYGVNVAGKNSYEGF